MAGNEISEDVSALTLSDFDLLKTISSGTFGTLVSARSPNGKKFVMKVMSKSNLVLTNYAQKAGFENQILERLDHPFLVKLLGKFQDPKNLYQLFPFYSGVDLFGVLRQKGKLDSLTAQFYTCEIICALEYLHEFSGIVFRNLKPETVLFDFEGHAILSDFIFAKRLYLVPNKRTYTLCGTPDYLAPEVVIGHPQSFQVDIWTLGILIYEMLAGFPPFFDEEAYNTYAKILRLEIKWPLSIEPLQKDLISNLLRRKPLDRGKIHQIKDHRWFKSVNWDEVPLKSLKPPFVPTLEDEPKEEEDNQWRNVEEPTEEEQKLFNDF